MIRLIYRTCNMNPIRNLFMYYVYVLQNKYQRWYIGSTGDLQKRISEHNSGKSRSTKYGVPWKVIYCEININ